MTKDKIVSVFKILRDNDPDPITELTFKSHFQLLVAVILSAQATDKSVNAATSKLFKDAHVFRVSNRLGLAPGKTVEIVEKKLIKNIPDEFKKHAHHWLIILGRYTCVARKPKCYDCNVQKFCPYKPKTKKA